jgi:hypothetical protein
MKAWQSFERRFRLRKDGSECGAAVEREAFRTAKLWTQLEHGLIHEYKKSEYCDCRPWIWG